MVHNNKKKGELAVDFGGKVRGSEVEKHGVGDPSTN